MPQFPMLLFGGVSVDITTHVYRDPWLYLPLVIFTLGCLYPWLSLPTDITAHGYLDQFALPRYPAGWNFDGA
jgi:hypothetical protein